MSLNGCHPNNSHKSIKKAARSFQLQFLLISTLIMLYFEDWFSFEKTTKGIKSRQMISNEILWCPSIVFINVIILEHSTTIKKVKISQNRDRKGQNCNFKLLATLMINFLITMFIKMIERNPILSFETTFIIVESFWGNLVPKKLTYICCFHTLI